MIPPSAYNHINFSLAVIMLLHLNININLIIMCGAIVGSLLPDIDHRSSVMGRIIPLWILHRVFRRWTKIFKHGGITHTVLFILWIYLIYYFTEQEVILGICVGHASHVYIDHVDANRLTMLWYPFVKKRRRRK